MFEEITASSWSRSTCRAMRSARRPPRQPRRFTIHSAVHEVREDAGCVMHLHTPDGTAVSTSQEGLLPLNQTAQLVLPDLAYHDYEGVALDHDERPRLQRPTSGRKTSCCCITTERWRSGAPAPRPTCACTFFERACTMQVRTRMLGGKAFRLSDRARGDREERRAGPLSSQKIAAPIHFHFQAAASTAGAVNAGTRPIAGEIQIFARRQKP